jgi:DNA/RNA-binding domain of Phe-tRNA-synthetase-like protein
MDVAPLKKFFPTCESHPLLAAGLIIAEFSAKLEDQTVSDDLRALLVSSENAKMCVGEGVATTIRDLLRTGGYRPTGRGKPASEYLLRVAGEGALQSINLAVDINNAVSLHSGLPISVIDLHRCRPPLVIRVAEAGNSYVFNRSGQAMDLSGLLCVFDQEGPCANAVKDSERTKTSGLSQSVLYVLWSSTALPGVLDAATTWMAELLQQHGAKTLIKKC